MTTPHERAKSQVATQIHKLGVFADPAPRP